MQIGLVFLFTDQGTSYEKRDLLFDFLSALEVTEILLYEKRYVSGLLIATVVVDG